MEIQKLATVLQRVNAYVDTRDGHELYSPKSRVHPFIRKVNMDIRLQ